MRSTVTPRRRRRQPSGRVLACLAVAAVLLAGCSSGGGDSRSTAGSAPLSADPSGGAEVAPDPLTGGLDVCSLVTPAAVRQATGQAGDPSSRQLGRVPGYPGLTDRCGFGVAFDSFTLSLDVGLVPTDARVLDDVAHGDSRTIDGIGRAARGSSSSTFSTVHFVKGSTYVRLRAVRAVGEPSRLARLKAVARRVAARVPDDPPASDAQTQGTCAELDPAAVSAVLGADVAVSRSLTYADRSATCSFATGVGKDAEHVTLSFFTNQQAGPFFADQQSFGPSTRVRGVPGDAFTVPGTAYVVADDGQAVSVSGRFGRGTPAGKPMRATPALAGLLTEAAAQLV